MVNCMVEGCDRPVRAVGMCNRHYLQERRKRLGPCPIEGCDQLQHSGGLCPRHLRRLLADGEVGEGEPLYNRGSRRSLTVDGYVRLHRPEHPMATKQGWVLEHRMVAYDLGLLTGREDRRHVHHKDHDKQNNDPENLEVLNGHAHGRQHGRFPALDPKPLVDAYLAGETMPQIGARLGHNSGVVYRVIRRYERDTGLTIRRPRGST